MNPSAPDWRHGLQLALAVALAYGTSTLLHLPENFWAVMSALIVVRPTTGSTLGAGWDRVRGTCAGTLMGLGGVWVAHHGLAPEPVTLGLVAAIAFASAIVPGLRSAPISALIVLTSAGVAGHSALSVALLRTAEIAIGVAVGLAVSMAGLSAHARGRFDAASAAVLRQIADQLRMPDGKEREAAAAKVRLALRELTILGMGADREARWLQRGFNADAVKDAYERRARLLARIAHDAGALGRLAEALGPKADAGAWASLMNATAGAMDDTASGLLGMSATGPEALRSLLRPESEDGIDAATRRWAASSVRLLLQDLSRLLAAAHRKKVDARA